MTKKELEIIETILTEMDTADDKIDILERLYFEIKRIYREQCEKKLGHRPLI